MRRKRVHGHLNNEGLQHYIERWLVEDGKEYTVEDDVIRVLEPENAWIIYLRGIKRGRKKHQSIQIVDMLKGVDNVDNKYSMVFNDDLIQRYQFNEIPKAVREKMNISLLFVTKKGNVNEI